MQVPSGFKLSWCFRILEYFGQLNDFYSKDLDLGKGNNLNLSLTLKCAPIK